jgi:hypothetical protein
MKVGQMGRGERESGHRGGDSSKGRAIRGSNDKRRNLEDLEDDPYRDLRDEEGNLPDPVNDEYIWPTIEEEEDD